jgi:hypothetical protein
VSKKTLIIFTILVGIGLASYQLFNRAEYEPSAWVIDPSREPVQTAAETNSPIHYQDARLRLEYQPLARYRIAARVLRKKKYKGDWSAQISPLDLALGWGQVAEDDIVKHLKINQMLRWYQYRFEGNCPVPGEYLAYHSSNHHIVSASVNLRKAFKRVHKGDVIEMEGYLIRVTGSYKGRSVNWSSSLTREDTGNHACELMYVEKLQVGDRVYR